MSRSNEWGESLEKTIERSQAQGGLLVYSMMPDEEIEVTIAGLTEGDIRVEEDRTVKAVLIEQRTGKLRVTEDTAAGDNWAGREICLGSSVFSIGEIELVRGGLLRGLIARNQGVVVDLAAQHFEGREPNYLMAKYQSLSLEGQDIF